ncbi:hypothetical protein KY311_04315, partial [Candidatus Woesearchaeota archaeon]|nr:hypothetical protein [Candidatus Woesearchaeota archaeon]
FDYEDMSQNLVQRFGDFMKVLDEALYGLRVKAEDLLPIMKPYIQAVILGDEFGPLLIDADVRRKESFFRKYRAMLENARTN